MGSKAYLMLLVVLGVVRSAFSGGCPEANDIYPCTCEESDDDNLSVFCHDRTMSQLAFKRILTAFDRQYSLDISLFFVKLGTVAADFFEGFNIRVLDFSHSQFSQIRDDEGRVLVGLEDSLAGLVLISSFDRHNWLDVLNLSHLKELSELHLAENSIPQLSDDWFKNGPAALTDLYIMDNGIETLGENAFANLPNLETLWLDGNQFGEFKRSMLPNPATHLEELQLNDNNFGEFPEDIFTEMPALKRLSLTKNNLKVIHEVTFKNIWIQLDHLDIYDNPLNCEDSVLEWMVKASHTPSILGVCAEPPEREGRDIDTVIEGN